MFFMVGWGRAPGRFLQWPHVPTRPVPGCTRSLGAPTRCCGLGCIAPPGQSERRATGGRHAARRPRTDSGGRGLGQDACAHHPHCLAAAKRLRHARWHSGCHFHEQGRQRDGGAFVRHAAGERAWHVDRHLPRPVQSPFARAPQGGGPVAVLSNFGHARPAIGHQAPVQAAQRGRRAFSAQTAGVFHCQLQGRRPAPCQRGGVVDFGELMLRSYELLRDNDPIREHYQRRFQHILVDEFQDTNKLQYAWLKQLAGNEVGGRFEARGSVIAVGDDDQSIYAFRGARVGNMTDFVREFDVQRQNKLEQNYRSYSNILDSANALISHNSRRLGKNLRTTQGAGEPVRVYEASSDLAEAQWMVDEIKQLVRNEGFERKEIAVLYRSNAQSRVIESALFNASVPYRVYGGLRFFERAEIKHALAYLRLLENPHDDTSFTRVVNFPPRGIGARSI